MSQSPGRSLQRARGTWGRKTYKLNFKNINFWHLFSQPRPRNGAAKIVADIFFKFLNEIEWTKYNLNFQKITFYREKKLSLAVRNSALP